MVVVEEGVRVLEVQMEREVEVEVKTDRSDVVEELEVEMEVEVEVTTWHLKLLQESMGWFIIISHGGLYMMKTCCIKVINKIFLCVISRINAHIIIYFLLFCPVAHNGQRQALQANVVQLSQCLNSERPERGDTRTSSTLWWAARRKNRFWSYRRRATRVATL